MALQPLTIHLPDSIYKRLVDMARRSDRPLEEETVDLLNEAIEKEDQLDQIEERLNQMIHFSDDELWNAAQTFASEEDGVVMQTLLEKKQRKGLTLSEQEQVNALSNHFNQIMLVRAKAAVLLIKRGHDISSLPTSK